MDKSPIEIKKVLAETSIASKLGWLQNLADTVSYKDNLPQDVIGDAITLSEVGVQYYEKMFLGRCSLKAMIEFDPEKAEQEIDEMIIKYRKLLGYENA